MAVPMVWGMFLLRDDERLVLSPSDLRLASQCEFALVRELDVTLGRAPRPVRVDEAMMERLKELGDAHERQELLRLSAAYPGRVRQFPRPPYDLASLTAAHDTTIATLRGDDTDVVFQATFFDGGLVGHVVCTRGTVGAVPAVGLGPIAVLPSRQRGGVGSALVHAVLGAADALREPLVALLGNPGYYGRFGFEPASAHAILAPDPDWGDYFQVRLLADWTPAATGAFTYAAPFGRL